MTLSLTQNFTMVGVGITASFLGVGGTSPYAYTVKAGGAGGTINSSTGVYTAPALLSSDPTKQTDIIQVTDAGSAKAAARIRVGSPIKLFADVIQQGLGLADDRIWLWDQKIQQPTDDELYVAVSVPVCQPFGASNKLDAAGNSVRSVNMKAQVDINIISRNSSARDRKEEVVLALISDYSQLQQTANSFYIAPLPSPARFVNISSQDGAAIPYRYVISVHMQYFVVLTAPTPYFDTISNSLVIEA